MVNLQERQTAHDTLFGTGGFDLNHNLTAYNELVAEKYSDNTAVTEPARMSVQLESYYEMPQESEAPAYAKQEILQDYAPAQRHAPFRPKIFDTNLEEIDFTQSGLASPELIAEVEIASEPVAEITTMPAVQEKIEQETAFTPSFKLNGKGMIAVVSFIAVTVLVLALIIVNSVSISGASGRIGELQAQNAEYASVLSEKQLENTKTYNDRAQEAQEQVFAEGSGYSQVTQGTNPDTPAWNLQKNPDYGTNFFDKLGNLFNNLFS